MSDDRGFERAMHAWLESGSDRTPPAAIDAVLLAARTTPQERGMRAPWRTPDMNTPLRLAAALATVAVLGVAGLLYLTREPRVGVTPTPSAPAVVAPSPTATGAPRPSLPPVVTGLIAFSKVTNATATIAVAAPDGTGMRPLISAPVQDVQPAWSPDGRRIAWATRNGIWIAQADGSGVVKLTEDGRDRDPAWSPDGTRIVFASSRDGDLEIYVEPVGGGGLTQLTDNDIEDSHPSWSAASDKIAFTSDRAGSRDIWTMDPDGENPGQLTLEGGEDDAPAWSPDGSTIAFTSDREGDTSLAYVMNADGSGIERLTTGDVEAHDPAWSPDGRYIAFSGYPTAETGAAIVIVDVAGRRIVGSFSQLRGELNYPTWRR
jgi:tol-pal system beta propeller repeat protein TolB